MVLLMSGSLFEAGLKLCLGDVHKLRNAQIQRFVSNLFNNIGICTWAVEVFNSDCTNYILELWQYSTARSKNFKTKGFTWASEVKLFQGVSKTKNRVT
jgi:hypothetical protein